MNCKLAVMALLSTAVTAQAQGSVTIYGLVDAAVSTVRQGAGTTTPGGSTPVATAANRVARLDSGVGPGSRLGFRGTEDLGGGLSATFLTEMGFSIDTGVSTQGGLLFGRQIFVGLASNAGWSITAGRQYPPINLALGASDAMGGSHWGQFNTNSGIGVYESIGAAPGGGAFQSTARVDNSVLGTYKVGAVSASLLVSAGNENRRRTGRVVNPGLTYRSGPLRLDATYATIRQPAEQITAAAVPEKMRQWLVGGSYDFGVAKLFAGQMLIEGPRNRANLSPAFLASPFTYEWNEVRHSSLGIRMPLGANAMTLQGMRSEYRYPAGPDGRSTVVGALYEHALSKRTALYANYGRASNNAFAKANLFATLAQVPANGYGATHSAFSLGMRHSF